MKKIISIVIVVSLLMSVIVVSASEVFYDVYSTNSDSLSILDGLSLLPDGEIEAEDITTRAVFCAMLAKALGMSEADSAVYKDVPAEYWAAGEISCVVSAGLLKGAGNGYFFPDEPIKTKDMINAVSTIVYQGENSSGLWSLQKLGVTKGINISKAHFTNEETATLIFQMLDNCCYEIKEISDYRTELALAGETMFARIHNIYERKGVLDAFSYSSKQCSAEINGVKYRFSDDLSYVRFLLGKEVVAYTLENDDGNRILYIRENEKVCKTTKILSKDIKFEKGKVSYYSGEKRYSRRIVQNPVIYINGELCSEYSWNNLNCKTGWTEFIDRNDDRTIDCVLQYRPVTAVIAMVNSGKKLIEDFYQINSLDLGEDDVSYAIFDKDGNTLDLSELEKEDVLSIFKGKKHKDVVIIRSADNVSGMLDGIDEDSCSIDGQWYGIDNDYPSSEHYNLSIGLSGTFYRNMFGDIVASRIGTSDMSYGILMATDDGEGIKNSFSAKIFTQNGKAEIISGESKVKINGKPETAKDADTFLKAQGMYQLVRYKVNSKNVLTEIELATTPKNKEVPYDTSCFTLNYKGNTKMYFDIMGPGYKANSKTKVFVIPPDRTDEDSYQVGDKTLLPTDYTDVSFYDCGEDYMINTAVVEYNSGKGAGNSVYGQNLVVLKSIGKCINRNGEVVPIVHYMQMGQLGSVVVKSNGLKSLESRTWPEYSGKSLESLKAGDVFQFLTDSFGEMSDFHVLYSSPYPAKYIEKGTTTPTKDFMVSMLTTCYGQVLHKNSEAIIVNANGMGDVIDYSWNRIYRTAGISVTIVTESSGQTKIVKGGREDIKKGDSVFVRASNGAAKELIIYRKEK